MGQTAIWRFWCRQNDAARLCLATALGALVAGGIGGIVIPFAPNSTAAGMWGAVGLFYLLLAAGGFFWTDVRNGPELCRVLASPRSASRARWLPNDREAE